LRNRIVHGYWSIDLDVIHATAERQLPSFVAELRVALEVVRRAEDDEPLQGDAGDSPGDL
jgi:uncharacterized protein with HEPN domain